MVCLISVSALLVAACSTGAEAFVVKPPANQISVDSPTSLFAVTKSDAEALLKKARELKAVAAEAEKCLHEVLLEKQAGERELILRRTLSERADHSSGLIAAKAQADALTVLGHWGHARREGTRETSGRRREIVGISP